MEKIYDDIGLVKKESFNTYDELDKLTLEFVKKVLKKYPEYSPMDLCHVISGKLRLEFAAQSARLGYFYDKES